MESREGVVMGNENVRIELDFSVGKQGKVGPQGEKGNDGKSAYQIAVDNGFQGSEAEWIESFMRVNPNTINTTIEEIISLRDTNKLIPSQTYHITDYISHYDEFEIESAKHPYDLIVTANSLNSFFEDAKATIHEGDDYFANSDLSKWQLKINNDLKVIWMKDEFNNEAPYDFKNVLFSVLYGDELLSLYTFSIDGNDYSLNPTAESLIGTEIEIVHTIGMCENNIIKGCSIPEGFQGVCVISQSTYAIENEILTGIENNRINLDKEVNFIILNSWGTASNNNVNIDNGSYVYIPQVRGFDENIVKGLVTIDCIPYTLEQHYDLLGTFSSNIITNSKIKNKGSHNFYENSVCETEYHNLNIQLDNCKIISCTWKINITIEGVHQVHLFDNLTAINSYFDLNYRSNPDMPTVGEVFQKPGGDWWVGDKVQWYADNVSSTQEPIPIQKWKLDELKATSKLYPGQKYVLDDYKARYADCHNNRYSEQKLIITASTNSSYFNTALLVSEEGMFPVEISEQVFSTDIIVNVNTCYLQPYKVELLSEEDITSDVGIITNVIINGSTFDVSSDEVFYMKHENYNMLLTLFGFGVGMDINNSKISITGTTLTINDPSIPNLDYIDLGMIMEMLVPTADMIQVPSIYDSSNIYMYKFNEISNNYQATYSIQDINRYKSLQLGTAMDISNTLNIVENIPEEQLPFSPKSMALYSPSELISVLYLFSETNYKGTCYSCNMIIAGSSINELQPMSEFKQIEVLPKVASSFVITKFIDPYHNNEFPFDVSASNFQNKLSRFHDFKIINKTSGYPWSPRLILGQSTDRRIENTTIFVDNSESRKGQIIIYSGLVDVYIDTDLPEGCTIADPFEIKLISHAKITGDITNLSSSSKLTQINNFKNITTINDMKALLANDEYKYIINASEGETYPISIFTIEDIYKSMLNNNQ